ncbi:MAG: ABC transporter permease [Clostridia bacterium]|nr:ABC transporter permease [Clostridia bacterium]
MSKISEFFKGYADAFTLNIREHKENMTQVLRLSVADLKKTYTGSALGWAWAVIKPVFTIFIYWFAVSIGLRSGNDIGEYPYILWLIAGIVPWFFMTECITGGTVCIRKYSYLVTKMKYPLTTIPTFTNLSSLYVHLVLVVISIIMFWVMGFAPTVYLVQLPIYTILMFLFFNAWSLFAGMVSAISKDFSNLIKSVNIGIFWLSGVIWNIESVADNKLLKVIMMLNPVTFICYGYRNCFVDHKWFFEEPVELGVFIAWYVVLAVMSLWAYKKLRKEIPDVL